jgi:hypothetical protein
MQNRMRVCFILAKPFGVGYKTMILQIHTKTTKLLKKQLVFS